MLAANGGCPKGRAAMPQGKPCALLCGSQKNHVVVAEVGQVTSWLSLWCAWSAKALPLPALLAAGMRELVWHAGSRGPPAAGSLCHRFSTPRSFRMLAAQGRLFSPDCFALLAAPSKDRCLTYWPRQLPKLMFMLFHASSGEGT